MFNESNTVEQMILDAASKRGSTGTNWGYVSGPELPRRNGEVMVESWLRESLINLNPDIAAQPSRAGSYVATRLAADWLPTIRHSAGMTP